MTSVANSQTVSLRTGLRLSRSAIGSNLALFSQFAQSSSTALAWVDGHLNGDIMISYVLLLFEATI